MTLDKEKQLRLEKSFDAWFDVYSANYSKAQWSLRDAWNAAVRFAILDQPEPVSVPYPPLDSSGGDGGLVTTGNPLPAAQPEPQDTELQDAVVQVIYGVRSKCLNWQDFIAFLPAKIVDVVQELGYRKVQQEIARAQQPFTDEQIKHMVEQRQSDGPWMITHCPDCGARTTGPPCSNCGSMVQRKAAQEQRAQGGELQARLDENLNTPHYDDCVTLLHTGLTPYPPCNCWVGHRRAELERQLAEGNAAKP